MIYTANYETQNESFNLNEVILKDLNLNEIEVSKVNVGEYIYLYIKKDNKYNYCNNTNYRLNLQLMKKEKLVNMMYTKDNKIIIQKQDCKN